MSGVQSNIPLGYNPQPLGPNVGQAVGTANALMQFQNAQQEQQRQNKLRDILGSPGAIDKIGQPTPETMSAVMGVDPNVGLKLQQNALSGGVQRAQLQQMNLKRQEQLFDLSEPVRAAAMAAYSSAPGDEVAKRQAGQRVYTEELNRAFSGGQMSDEEKALANPTFDPVRVGAQSVRWQDMQKQKDVEKHQATQEADTKRRLDIDEKRQASTDADRGMATGVDADGRPIVLRPGAPAGQPKATYFNDGSPVPDDKLTGAHKMGSGSPAGTPAAAAEHDAMITAASRIKAAEDSSGKPLSEEEKAKMRQDARSDPKVQEAMRKSEAGAISDDAADLTARESLKGDWHGTVGLGRNQASMRKISDARARIAKEEGITGEELAANTAEFNGIVAAERVLGTRGAGIDLGIAEAQKFAPMVLELSDRIDRTRFPTFNALQLAAEKGVGGEDVIRMTDALNAYKMAYTQILTRGGMPTDDSRRRSDEVIDKAWSSGQIRAAIDQLNKEMQGARSAVPSVRDELFHTLTGKTRHSEVTPVQAGGEATPGQAAPAPPDVAYLRANPDKAAMFDKHFGAGAAEKILGAKP